MVFDATVGELNEYLWEPNFMIPVVASFFMMVGPETHMVDLDAGEIFYKFRRSSVLGKYFGVYLGNYLKYKETNFRKNIMVSLGRNHYGFNVVSLCGHSGFTLGN